MVVSAEAFPNKSDFEQLARRRSVGMVAAAVGAAAVRDPLLMKWVLLKAKPEDMPAYGSLAFPFREAQEATAPAPAVQAVTDATNMLQIVQGEHRPADRLYSHFFLDHLIFHSILSAYLLYIFCGLQHNNML